ncbi:MAG: integrase family protein [Spongiibacteraceae bacterium]
MVLTAIAVKSAKPKEKDYKLTDGRGLYLLIKKNGSKYWRQKYRIAGKEKLLALGVYPETSLAEAREQRDLARKKIAEGIDPVEFGKLLVKIDQYKGTQVIRVMLALAPLLFQRPNEVASMEWKEIDLTNKLWIIPKEKKKERNKRIDDHIVPPRCVRLVVTL